MQAIGVPSVNRIDMLTLIFLAISIFYAVIVDRFIRSRGEKSFFAGMAFMAPGLLLILTLFAWLAFGFSFRVLLVLAMVTALYIAMYTFLLKTLADWLAGFPSIQRWRKTFLKNRILAQQKKGRSAQEIQNKGLIPDNQKLKEFGFSDQELSEFGLLK